MKIIRNIFSPIVGIILGGSVNMALIMSSPYLISPPEGVDVSNPESIKASLHLFKFQHFIMPFLAHAIGTFVGCLSSYLIAASHKSIFSYGIGFFYLLGGISATFMIPAPLWFIVLDLTVAYLPMAWLAIKILKKDKN